MLYVMQYAYARSFNICCTLCNMHMHVHVNACVASYSNSDSKYLLPINIILAKNENIFTTCTQMRACSHESHLAVCENGCVDALSYPFHCSARKPNAWSQMQMHMLTRAPHAYVSRMPALKNADESLRSQNTAQTERVFGAHAGG